jgi:asparagine synthase (glutamine-hydrolysing)
MAAVFGAVGRVTGAELTEMGRRLAHRGPLVAWEEVASGVFLGGTDVEPPAVIHRDGTAAVVDRSVTPGMSPADIVDTFLEGGLHGLERLPTGAALVAWDDHSETLNLARDLVGQKPLHYCRLRSGGVAFASEYKALYALDAVPVEPDFDALQYLQCYKLTPPGRTLLKDIHIPPPGAIVRLGKDGTVRSRQEIPRPQVQVAAVSERAACKELARRLVSATRPLVEHQGRIGVSLSGGIDSLAVAYACRLCAPDAELVGFTAGDDEQDPEIRIAATAMERLGGRHEAVYVTAQPLIDNLPLAVWHFENPVGRTETMQSLEVGRAAQRDGFRWLMSGLGSDGLFAGMPRHKLLWLSQLLPPIRKDLHELYALTQCGQPPGRLVARLLDFLVYRGSVPPVPHVRTAAYPEAQVLPQPGPEFLNHALVANVRETLSRSLVRLERPFQAFGVDLASPFFDREVIDYAFMVPSRLKIRRGQEKYILRQAMASFVSPDLLNLPKGIARIRHDGAFADVLQQLSDRYLSPESVAARGWFDVEEIRRIRTHLRNPHYHAEAAMRLWTPIVTEIWARIYVDQRGQRPSA